MKITSVDIVKAFKEPSVAAEVAVGNVPWHPVFVRINTDEGISGLGEVGVAYGNAQTAGFGMAVDFAKCIIGMDPMNNEEIWNKLHRMTFWGMGNGGVIMAGISGIDIALWDIKGKALGVPCYKLLGGKTNHKLRAYASQLQFDWGKVSHSLAKPEEYAEAMRKAMADGFDAVKVDPVGFDANGVWMGRSSRGILQRDQMKLAVDRVAAMREVGPDVDIIIELHALTDATTSVQLGRELAKLGCFYYEEPTQPTQPESLPRDLVQGRDSDRRWRAHVYALGLSPVLRGPLHQHHSARPVQHRWYHRGQEDLRHGARVRHRRPGALLRWPGFGERCASARGGHPELRHP